MSNKPREFWLCGTEFVGLMYRKISKPTEEDEVHYHVIEYSAYQALLEQAERMAGALSKNCQDDGNYDNCSNGNCWKGCIVYKEKALLLKQWQEFKK